MNPAGLFAALGGIPALSGAHCRGPHQLFDPSEDIEQRALWLCASRPVLAACKAWCDSLPASRRPLGVVAGRINTPEGHPR